MKKKMRIPNSLYFFQNGANPLFKDTSILDGQGHVTAIHLASGQVSELHIPPPRVRVSLRDIVKRNLLPCILNGIFCLSAVHTGTANTAVIKTTHGVVAVEEASKPFLLDMRDGKITSGRWLFNTHPIGVHPDGGHMFSYMPYRAKWPLSIDSKPIPWHSQNLPIMIHSIACVQDVVAVPLMSARIGSFMNYLFGHLSIPIQETHNFQWLLYNTTTGHACVVDMPFVSNVLHIVQLQMDESENLLHIYACHVRNLSKVVQLTHMNTVHPEFEFRKDTIRLDTGQMVRSKVFPEASGDFPNSIDDRTVLINSLKGDKSNVIIFDTVEDRIVHRVSLPCATDVLYYQNHLLYCTLDEFRMYDMLSNEIVYNISIPPRISNFHASLLDLEI